MYVKCEAGYDVCVWARLGSSDKERRAGAGAGGYWPGGWPRSLVNIGKEGRYDDLGWGDRASAGGHERYAPSLTLIAALRLTHPHTEWHTDAHAG